MFGLQQEFDPLDGGSEGLGGDAGESACEEVEEVEVVASDLLGLGQVSVGHLA